MNTLENLTFGNWVSICKILGKEKWHAKTRRIYYIDALCMCMTRYMLEEVPKIVH